MLAPGMYPFWFWNGDLVPEEIEWQIREMAAGGVRGFFIHPRQGLKQPYLSESFFRIVEHAVSTAEALGLVVHLYDEYPYPSGVAGGEVTLGNPRFHATRLVQRIYDSPGGHVRLGLPRGKVLNCTAYHLEGGRVLWESGVDLRSHVGMVLTAESYNEVGLTQYNRKRYFASQPTPTLDVHLAQQPVRIYASVQAVVERHKYWWHFVDVLNPEAVRTFLDLTHERYYQRLGDRFGASVYSIFVDETEPGWSERIPHAFQAAHGYDLLPLLPALQDGSHPQHLQVMSDLARLMYRLFCETFDGAISGWCKAHNIRYSGEKPSFRLAQLRYLDIPGCEPGHTKAGAPMDLLRPRLRQNARATASAAYFYGKEGALCECFHSLGWSATLQDAKLISEGLALMGVTYLVPHGFFYTTHALTKHDAPPTFFYQMPYWRFFQRLTQRLERIYARFEGTHIDARVLVVDPGSGLPTETDLATYERLMAALMAAQVDFLVVDTDILERGEAADGRLCIRDLEARVVILPPLRLVEEPLALQLQRLEAAGVEVVRLTAPAEVDDAVAEVKERVGSSVELRAVAGSLERLYLVTRTDGRRRTWFLLNTGADALEIAVRSPDQLQELPLDAALPPRLTRSETGYERALEPFESVLLSAGSAPEVAPRPPTVHIPVNNPVRVTPYHPNLLRLGRWRMALLDEEGRPYAEETVTAVPLANQLAQGRFRWAPAVDTSFGSMPALRLPMLDVRYQAVFDCAFDGAVALVMEPGSIVGAGQIQINESSPFTEADFHLTEAHVRGSLGLDITPFLRQGRNQITIAVQTDRLDGGLRNPLYLAGTFGVALDPPRLVERPPHGEFEAYEANGLPFYAGVVEYGTTFELDAVPEGETCVAAVEYGRAFQEASEIAINDGPWRPLPWSPYRTLVASAEFVRGVNRLRIQVYTSLIRAFEGQWFDPVSHTYRDIGA
jgi:hypothetical protein